MKERSVHRDITFPAHHQATKISKPRKRPFDLPPSLIASQLPSLLSRQLLAVFAMRTNQINASPGQTMAQRVRSTRLVIDHALGALAGTSPALSGHRNRLQGRLQQLHFGGGRRCQEVSHRNTVAVDHHHPLRAFAPLGCADAGPPFLAGAKLPSAQASDQSSCPWLSSWPRKVRQALRQMSCSSHSRRRRQHVLGDGYRVGRSFQRAPVRNIHKMPSKHGRLGIGFGPPQGEALGSGNKGAIFSHCASVSSEVSRAIFYLLSMADYTSKLSITQGEL
jgi:hypothetical protein